MIRNQEDDVLHKEEDCAFRQRAPDLLGAEDRIHWKASKEGFQEEAVPALNEP